MYYLIEGTQIDGEHQYRIRSVVESDVELVEDSALQILIENHAFGFDDRDPGIDYDDFYTYGDGLTAITKPNFKEITDSEYAVLCKLGMAY